MDRRRLSSRAVAALVLLGLLLPAAASAYPIDPVPLWPLVERAKLIVVAEVVSVDRYTSRDEMSWNSRAARLRVIETLKGIERLEVLVPYPAGLTCPSPPLYLEGQTVVAFLARWDDEWSTVALSYGTLYPRGESLDDVTTMVREAVRIQRAKLSAEALDARRHAWLVQAAALPGTRWHGLYELASWTDAMHRYYDRTDRPDRRPLTVDEIAFLADALVDAPRYDRTFAMMLRTLAGHGGEAVDHLALGTLESLLMLDEPPYWATDLLWAVLERQGDSEPESRLKRFCLDSLDLPPPGVLRTIWSEAKGQLEIPDVAPREIDTTSGPPVGERTLG